MQVHGYGIKSLTTGHILYARRHSTASDWLDKLDYMNNRNPYNLAHNLRFEIVAVNFNRHGVGEAL